MSTVPIEERNQDATIYVGGLDEKVSEELLWELFVQVGPISNLHMPKDRIALTHQGYGFVEFLTEEDADYAIRILNMIKLFGKPIRVNKASSHQKNADVGANLFIGNLDPETDEKLIYDTFSAFGVILKTPSIQRDPESGNSKGFAFINFASFAASDAAIEAMSGQYLNNRQISVSYAFKKDSMKSGERHGSAAERLLAAQNPLSTSDMPHQRFATEAVAPPPQAMGGFHPSTMVSPHHGGMVNGRMPPPMPPMPPNAGGHLAPPGGGLHHHAPTNGFFPPPPPQHFAPQQHMFRGPGGGGGGGPFMGMVPPPPSASGGGGGWGPPPPPPPHHMMMGGGGQLRPPPPPSMLGGGGGAPPPPMMMPPPHF